MIPDEEEETKEEFNALTEHVLLNSTEIIECSVSKFGDINKFECIGTVSFTVTDSSKSNCKVKLNMSEFGQKLKFRIPPDFDKQAWNKNRVF